MSRKRNVLVAGLVAFTAGLVSFAPPVTAAEDASSSQPEASPWLIVPVVSSNPKVGTSAGGMVSYLFKLDPESTSSMVGIGGTYSTTDSYGAGLFLRSYWDGDRKRLNGVVGTGRIKNDYEDFLGSGLPANTTDNLRVAQARYLQAVTGDWFVGVQGIHTNYLISAEGRFLGQALDLMGLTGFDSGALGLVGLYDSRNNQNTPTSGRKMILHNYAYRPAFGGEESFDVINLDYRHYVPLGDNVFAYRLAGRWTSDATPSGYSSVDLRGYTRGQYLAPHSATLEAEQRMKVSSRWGVNVFAGVACLYGKGDGCSDSENLYPSYGIGGEFILSPSEQLAMTFDFAAGKSDNHGLYMRFGHQF